MSSARYNVRTLDNTITAEITIPKVTVTAITKSLVYKAGMNNIDIIEKRLKDIEVRQAAEMEKLATLFMEVARTHMEKFARELENVDTHVSEEEQGDNIWGKL